MSQISRRTLIKASAATAAAAAVAAPGVASAEMMESPKEHPGYPAAKESAAIFPENPLPESDLSLTGSFNLGKSQLNEGESITAFRWGVVRPVVKGGRIVGCKPFEHDYQPSVNLQGIAEMPYSTARIRYPMVRESYLKNGPASRAARGDENEKWVRVSWDKALELAAKAIRDTYDNYGPSAVYGSSYGWMSTGKLNAAITCQHRLLNLMGGFVGRRNSYSSAAVNTIFPYVVGTGDPRSTSWDVVIKHSERVVFWGCDPVVTNDIDWYTTLHNYAGYLRALKKKGTKTISVNPVETDTAEYMGSEWIHPNPGTDPAVMAAMIYELDATGKIDKAFLDKYTYGWAELRRYIVGEEDGVKKTPEWAEKISGVPASKIRSFAHEVQEHRTMFMIGWGIQRIDFGEQSHWMLAALCSVLGQIGLPGGGLGTNYHYSSGGSPLSEAPFMAQIPSSVKPVRPVTKPWKGSKVLPVAAVSDALLHPGKTVDYDGKKVTFPDFHLVMWAGGNPFAHHPDTNQLARAFKKPDTVIVTDIVWTATARHADIVLPACTAFEHNDITNIGTYSNDGFIAMKQAIEPQWEAKPDYDIFSALADKLGIKQAYTEGRSQMDWIRKFYNDARQMGATLGQKMPDFDTFWKKGYLLFPVSEENRNYVSFADFRADPKAHPLSTESGKIQLFSPKIAGYHYNDCLGHPTYFQPTEGVAAATKEFPLALMACRSRYRMHSQLDCTATRLRGTIEDREPVWINPKDAKARGIQNGDICLVKSRRGQILAGAVLTDRIIPGVIVVHHGGWFNPRQTAHGVVDVRGNSNTLVLDKPTSKLARGNLASTANVEVSLWKGAVPEVTVYDQPPRTIV